jgi:hypothetical protein
MGRASRNGHLAREPIQGGPGGDIMLKFRPFRRYLRQITRIKPMSETADWKQKYRDSLREMEAEEKRWREVERVLRRLIGRLCAAAMGVDPQLDDELAALAAANRRNADALQLEKLAGSLTVAVVAVDATSPVRHLAASVPHLVSATPHPAASDTKSDRWNSTCAALASLLEQIKRGEPDPSKLLSLTADLEQAETDAALAAVVARIADMIHARGESLARERQQAAAVLAEVTQRLEEMSNYLLESDSASRSRFDDTESLNDTMMSHVRELTNEVSGAAELGLLQSAVSARLESVSRQICDFRAREAVRLIEYNGRAEHMRERIADLEREAQELHSKLDLEKHGARRRLRRAHRGRGIRRVVARTSAAGRGEYSQSSANRGARLAISLSRDAGSHHRLMRNHRTEAGGCLGTSLRSRRRSPVSRQKRWQESVHRRLGARLVIFA